MKQFEGTPASRTDIVNCFVEARRARDKAVADALSRTWSRLVRGLRTSRSATPLPDTASN